MVSRKTRALIAKQTLDITESGKYVLTDGRAVSIAKSVKRAISATVHYAPEDFETVVENRNAVLAEMSRSGATQFRVANTTTLAAACELLNEESCDRVLCLNFASAKNPGGGFLKGSQAQEESIARSTALHACISRKRRYYDNNRECGTCLYTDHMIYSPLVPVFRDGSSELLPKPWEVSIITAPAVNAGAVRRNEPDKAAEIAEVMLGRIEKVLSLAVVHQHRFLVLGAWGCGVFQNDPADVAGWFHHHLRENETFKGAFDTVVFAVLDRSEGLETLRPFQDRFA